MRSSLVARLFLLVSLATFTVIGCSGNPEPVVSAPAVPLDGSVDLQTAPQPADACWGQATKVLARMGMMGEHASMQENPRVGLRNLARELADLGIIPDDSMASLGAFVADELGLDIGACMN